MSIGAFRNWLTAGRRGIAPFRDFYARYDQALTILETTHNGITVTVRRQPYARAPWPAAILPHAKKEA